MPAPAKIKQDQLLRLLSAGATAQQIAEEFGVGRVAVYRACDRFGYAVPGRKRPALNAYLSPANEPSAPAYDPDSREGQLAATDGRWRALAAWADAWGVSQVEAVKAWSAFVRRAA